MLAPFLIYVFLFLVFCYSIISNLLTCSSAHKSGTGGNATEARDSAGGVEKAKREHPEAPDPAIGMQDERGGRGG